MKNIEQSLKRNGPLDAQGIEMRLVDCRRGGGGGGGGGRVLSALVWPIQNAFVGSIALGRQLITSLLFRPPLKAPSDPEKERISRRARYRADPEKRQRYCHSPERASRSAKELRSLKGMSYLYNPSHIKMDYLTCYTAHNRV